jgi:cytochrome c oxidase cbb3-type subunit III
MNSLRSALRASALLASMLVCIAVCVAQAPSPKAQVGAVKPRSTAVRKSYPAALVESGGELFRKDCSFCHGRDADGGESGPDLTMSKLVTEDVDGNKIGAVVRNGRPDRGMPPFNLSPQEIASVAAFIHTRQNVSLAKKGGRKGVAVSDLQTGDVAAGREYFNGAGGCATCHTPTGDLDGIASRYQGLQLEEQMLYPRRAKSKVTVTLASGQAVSGELKYLDEFTVGLVDSEGAYHSWRTGDVQYKIDAPVNAHIELFSKYTDDDIHNLMAYLQTLR